MLGFIKNLFSGKTEQPKVIAPIEESKPIAAIPVPVIPTHIKEETVVSSLSFLTPDKLKLILHNNPAYKEWYDLLLKYLPEYDITTIERASHFFANTAHESADYKVLEENLNYDKPRLLALFPKYFNSSNVDQYAYRKIAIGSRIYANRMGNGPEDSKDGWTFRGKGLIQITGKKAHLAVSKYVNKSIDETCKYLLTKEGGLIGSLYFWKLNNINQIADTKDIAKVRKAINGGLIGIADVTARYNTIKKILS